MKRLRMMTMMTVKPNLLSNGVVVQATIILDWKDRIRVLLGKKIHFYTNVESEFDPGRTQSKNSSTYVDTIFPRKTEQATEIKRGK